MCVYRRSNHLTRSLARGRASRDLLSALSLAIRYHNEPRRDPLHFFTVILCCNLSLSLSLSLSVSLRLFSASKQRPRPEYAAYIFIVHLRRSSLSSRLTASTLLYFPHPPNDSISTTAVTTTVIPLSRSLDGYGYFSVSLRERETNITAHTVDSSTDTSALSHL